MSQESSDDRRDPEVSASYPAVTEDTGIETGDERRVFVVVTQAWDGSGNSLIRSDGPAFDDFPGVTLFIELPDGRSGEVTLSPIHGDARKMGFTNVEPGTRCVIRGRKDGPELDKDEPCVCGEGTYHRIYLSPRRERGEVALICDIWGCHRSRILDNAELLSWVDY